MRDKETHNSTTSNGRRKAFSAQQLTPLELTVVCRSVENLAKSRRKFSELKRLIAALSSNLHEHLKPFYSPFRWKLECIRFFAQQHNTFSINHGEKCSANSVDIVETRRAEWHHNIASDDEERRWNPCKPRLLIKKRRRERERGDTTKHKTVSKQPDFVQIVCVSEFVFLLLFAMRKSPTLKEPDLKQGLVGARKHACNNIAYNLQQGELSHSCELKIINFSLFSLNYYYRQTTTNGENVERAKLD